MLNKIKWTIQYEIPKIGIRILDEIPHRLPKRWVNHVTMGNLGRLSVVDPRLHSKEVPTITVEDFGNAMKYDEGRRAA